MGKIFHHIDNDGYSSAAIAKIKFPDYTCIPYSYSNLFPYESIDLGEPVVIVDLCFQTQKDLDAILAKTQNVIWIDHHATSFELGSKIPGVRVLDRPAACILCWEYFFNDEPMPRVIELVSDFDTWVMKYGDETRLFNLAMSRFESPDDWLEHIKDPNEERTKHKVTEGRIIQKYLDSYYKTLIGAASFRATISGHEVFVCNSYRFNPNLYKITPKTEMNATFYFDGKKYHATIYSETVNCEEIAKRLGGGGHRSAAGFSTEQFPFENVSR